MIKLAEFKDLPFIAIMLQAMYKEVFGDEASDEAILYHQAILASFVDMSETILVDNDYRGFFIVKNISEPMLKTPRYQGTRVYIKPEVRHGKLLKEFYDELFKRFDKGLIFGNTEIDSPHIKVLDKRHKLISKVYELKRS